MAKVVETLIVNVRFLTPTPECSPDGFRVVGKHATLAFCQNLLFQKQLPSIEA